MTAAVEAYGNAELIVLDNGSTDGSYEILESEYRQALLCSVPGLTIAALRNRGTELAEGEYLLLSIPIASFQPTTSRRR